MLTGGGGNTRMTLLAFYQKAEKWLYNQAWYVQDPLSWLGHSLTVSVATIISRDIGLAVLGFYALREVEGALRRKRAFTHWGVIDSILDVLLPALAWWFLK